ncbi:MAG: hypothetical protein Q9164_005111 [Protoblastenia rupestris]
MPNKYSHALVLSNYEANGLTDFDPSSPARRIPSVRSTPFSRSARATKAALQPRGNKPSPTNLSLSAPRTDTTRIRLQDSPSPPPSRPLRLQHLRIKNSIDTQLPLPQQMPPQHPIPEQKTRPTYAAPEKIYPPRSPPRTARQHAPPTTDNQKRAEQPIVSPKPASRHQRAPSVETLEIAVDDSEWLPSTRLQRRHTNDTAIWDPRPAETSPTPQVLRQPVVSARKLAPQHPPTPPLTPKARYSWESFSLETDLDEPPPPLPLPTVPPLPNRHPHRPSPGITPSELNPQTTSQQIPSPSSSRPKTSAGHPNRPPSIAARRSSLNPTNSTKLTSLGSLHSDVFSSFSSPATSIREPSLDFDTDLEPLPPDLANDPEFSSLPWSNPDTRPAIFRLQQQERAPLSRSSSFDSAAPPPISISRDPERRVPAFLNENLPATKPPKLTKKFPSPSSSTFSFLGRSSRPKTPKGIPYTNTATGKTPAAVSVSRTAAPSIPSLFPSYRGAFPPPTSASQAAIRATAHLQDPYIQRERRRVVAPPSSNSAESETSSSSKPSRRSSLLGAKGGGDKRLSWLKTEPLDRALGRGEVNKKAGGENVKDRLVLS